MILHKTFSERKMGVRDINISELQEWMMVETTCLLQIIFVKWSQWDIFIPASVTVKKANKSDYLATYYCLTFMKDSDGKLSIRLHDKHDDFGFHVVNFSSSPQLTYHLAPLMTCIFCSSSDMHDAAHIMMILDITTGTWLMNFCLKATKSNTVWEVIW